MKLDINLSALRACADRMGPYDPDFTLEAQSVDDFELDTELSSNAGMDIQLENLDIEQGLLGYRGRQVLLFIPDHGTRAESVINGQADGNKYHVAECRTLDDMRAKKRFSRYKATYNVSGDFEIFGESPFGSGPVVGNARLSVCKNCLTMLNYKGYKTDSGARARVFNSFDIAEFLSCYTTLFKNMPKREMLVDMGGYSDDWKEISISYRRSRNWVCESCAVDLTQYPQLLHAHHINGNKRDNRTENLKALCIDCHRKQPKHGYMRVTHEQMQLLTRLRREQSVMRSDDWNDVLEMADAAVDGYVRACRAKGYAKPEVGYEVRAVDNNLLAELELAWPEKKFGVLIDIEKKPALEATGWKVISMMEALNSI